MEIGNDKQMSNNKKGLIISPIFILLGFLFYYMPYIMFGAPESLTSNLILTILAAIGIPCFLIGFGGLFIFGLRALIMYASKYDKDPSVTIESEFEESIREPIPEGICKQCGSRLTKRDDKYFCHTCDEYILPDS